jgi:uncharacterized membrane protein YfcA
VIWFAIGLILGFGMGMTLGLLGAGGSIMTVPILVYFFDVPPLMATAYSLLIVGLVASAGAIRYWSKHLVNIRSVLLFAIPAMCSVFSARSYLIPRLPDPMFHVRTMPIGKNEAIMLLFGFLMCLSAIFMSRKRADITPEISPPKTSWKQLALLIVCSSAIGLLTGAVGAGGGFLIVPALIEVFKLPVKVAIGTSLSIIAINSLIGFNGDLLAGLSVDWKLLLAFLATTLTGMLLGTSLSKKMDASKLSKLFAIFVLCVGLTVLGEEMWVIYGLPASSTIFHQYGISFNPEVLTQTKQNTQP